MADLIFAGITTPGQILHGRNAEEVALINWEAATWSDGSNPPGIEIRTPEVRGWHRKFSTARTGGDVEVTDAPVTWTLK
jgi:hypothetical protein